jgi:hypothetical protein
MMPATLQKTQSDKNLVGCVSLCRDWTRMPLFVPEAIKERLKTMKKVIKGRGKPLPESPHNAATQ